MTQTFTSPLAEIRASKYRLSRAEASLAEKVV